MTETDQELPRKGQRALVLGGGIAGLAAAAMLARHFERVTLLERDRYPAQPEVRLHTPHGAHVHLLLAGGLVTLTRLFPHLTGWLDEAGLVAGDLTEHTRVAYDGRWLPRARSGIPIRTCTRSHVELLLLRNARARRNVEIVDDCKVESLIGRERITGARVRRGGAAEELAADLVVDAMGRGTPSLRWLKEAGLPEVEEATVDPGIVYSSAWFEPPAGIDDDWMVMATLPALPGGSRMGVVVRFGAERMLCSHIGYGKQTSPRTTGELVASMEGLCVPHLHRLMRAAKPLSDVAIYGNTQNRWRRYGRLPSFPDGLVILGDAACSLNPRYGQGMTIASMSVERLDASLSRHFAERGDLRGFGARFQKNLEDVLRVPWQMALMEDRTWVSLFDGTRPTAGQRLVQAGAGRVLKSAFSDIDTYIRFMRVAHLLDRPTSMLAPRTLLSIARGGRPRGEAPADEPRIGPALAAG